MWDWDLCEKDDKPISRKIRVIGTIPALSFFLLFCVFIFWFYTFFLSSLIFFSYYWFIEDFFESILNFLKYHMSGTYPKISPQNKNDEKKLSFRIKFDEISPPPQKKSKSKRFIFSIFLRDDMDNHLFKRRLTQAQYLPHDDWLSSTGNSRCADRAPFSSFRPIPWFVAVALISRPTNHFRHIHPQGKRPVPPPTKKEATPILKKPWKCSGR